MHEFQLAPPLLESTIILGDLPLSRVLFKNQALFPWCVLVPRVNGITELFELSGVMQHQLIDEIALVSKAIQAQFQCKKLNVATLGNIVPQLHVHVVGRFEHDVCWPQSIWQAGVPIEDYHESKLELIVTCLKNRIGNWVKKSDN